jgi:glutathione synthase/RimK-type ligase-like ATP-grasp enzyme
MILIATNERDITSDYVVLELKRRKIPFVRLNTERLPLANIQFDPRCGVNSWTISLDNRQISLSSIRAGYYRRPGTPIVQDGIIDRKARRYCESEWSSVLFSALNSIGPKWLNSPSNIFAAEDKPRQLALANEVGLTIPDTIITNSLQPVLVQNSSSATYVAKPLRCALVGNGDEERVIFSNRIDSLDELDPIKLSLAPVIFQQEIEKESDIRVTIIGAKVFAVEILSQAHAETRTDWRRGARIDLVHRQHELPKNTADMCLSLTKLLGLNFGAIDLVLDKNNKYWFLEINPNGQWAWLENRTKQPLTKAIVDELERIAA